MVHGQVQYGGSKVCLCVDQFDLKNLPSQSPGAQEHSPGLTSVAQKKKKSVHQLSVSDSEPWQGKVTQQGTD